MFWYGCSVVVEWVFYIYFEKIINNLNFEISAIVSATDSTTRDRINNSHYNIM